MWGGLQLDEVALPIVLAYQLGRTDAGTWAHVKRAADFLLAFEQDGNRAPWTPQERWENQSGYSPATIAAEIAGLVCAADDRPGQRRRGVGGRATWPPPTTGRRGSRAGRSPRTGPYSAGPYFLRLTKDGNPNAGTTYNIGDSGPSNVDQRRVVDPSFLDLVRLGVLPADDPAVREHASASSTRSSACPTARGFFWHRASFDGYGEKADGEPVGLRAAGRLAASPGDAAWPLLNGERGEYRIAAGRRRGARRRLATMARAAGPGLMLPEQVWDLQPPAGARLRPRHADLLGDAAGLDARPVHPAGPGPAGRRVLEQPAIVAHRYTG